MLPIFIFLLKSMLVSGILLGYYWLALRNTRFHHYNRFYLVGSVLLSLALPLLDIQWFTLSTPASAPVQQVVQYMYNPQVTAHEGTPLGWEQILFLGLFLVSAILICFFLYGIFNIYHIKAKGKITVMERFNFIETALDEAPFSFFRNLFWRKDLPVQDETGQRMLKHELTHIEQHHSYDKLFISLATYVFWMNPFFWMLRKELEVVHEFIADEAAVADGDAGELAEMLLKAHYHSDILSVGQSFFYSSIKRRIIMLTSSKKVSYSYARRLLILPVAIGVLVLLSFTIKDSLSDAQNKQMDQSTIAESKLDTVPAKYRDPKTGQIKGSFQIDIDGDMASFKDIKSKKELFKVPLTELAGPANKKISVEGSPLYTEKKFMFISADTVSNGDVVFIGDVNSTPLISAAPVDAKEKKIMTKIIINGKEISPADLDKIDPSIIKSIDIHKPQQTPRIIINGKEISPADIDKIDPVNIKTIDVRGDEKGVRVTGKEMNGMTWTEATAADGKKIVTVKMDTVVYDVKGSSSKANAKSIAAVPVESNVYIQTIKGDTAQVKTVVGYKSKSAAKTVVVTTTDTTAATSFLKDPRTLTVTVNETEGGNKKTYTIIQKQSEKTDLPKDLLYIIDGKELQSGNMKDVDPSTIKSMNVLKGENAVKKYGEKGKNGVVEITTKKN